jgi:hypothetical protein
MQLFTNDGKRKLRNKRLAMSFFTHIPFSTITLHLIVEFILLRK